jgi:hypothetical protein
MSIIMARFPPCLPAVRERDWGRKEDAEANLFLL